MEKPVANGKHWHNDELRNFEQNLQKMSFHQSKDGAKKEQDVHSFPEGGWGWVVCLASFWTNGIIFGVMNCYGVIFVKLKDQFEATHSDDAAFLTSWVGSVSIGMTFLLSPVASILIDKIGIRRTAFLGGFLASLGMFLSSLIKNLELLYLTYGVVLGSGASLAYTPSLVILGHYFKQRLGLVNGLVTAGSSVFTTIVPLLLKYLLDVVGLMTTMQILSAGMALLMVCALTFTPRLHLHHEAHPHRFTSFESLQEQVSRCHNMLDLSIWKNKAYVLWVWAIPIALFGYFVPYVHLVQHARDILPDANGEVLVTCIGLTSGLGRIVFGKLADFPRVNRIHLQQLAFISIGLLTMLLVVANQFAALVVVCLLLGLFDGCFISLLGPIAFDIVGSKGASQAIGFLLGLCSIPLTVGPPIAGILYDHLGNYKAAFLSAGVPPLIGASLMCIISRVSQQYPSHAAEQLVEEAAAETTSDDEEDYNTIPQEQAEEIGIWEKFSPSCLNTPKESTQETLHYTASLMHNEIKKQESQLQTHCSDEKDKLSQYVMEKESSV
ncbi:monocarboxylate transporter 10-like isoform X2 [Limulus polyphemus]|uniref:Monocarboxylate transporter 10-like isoform X2 n=1 Tax=Limulus polyphemus TaxID=6850 RepID=A0ABM1SNV2_LIMPO|nr:monocarboxylate transporter 10-like isoform X2 [Limulus polyphemus]